jgi:TolB-like protein
MKKIIIVIILCVISATAWASGSSAAAGAVRGKYLAGQGIIVPPDQVHIDSHIAYIDYSYPMPADPLGITLYSGRRQLSADGQEEVIQVGIQGGKQDFEDLPPMNLAFVIDRSGSMNANDKMDWVKDAFYIFIDKVRDIDFVSLVVFDNDAQVVFPSTQMKTRDKRLKFIRAVQRISSGGGTNLVAGLELGYQQVMANFRTEYTNRVLFLTDGVGESTGILDMAESFKDMGINVSTIGVGVDFDLNLMVDLAKRGGGSSRFIADREEMEEIFGSELDRMIVPVARNLDMRLEFLQDVEILDTWGYQHRIEGREIHYFQPTLHHGDYETILVRVRIPPQAAAGEKELVRFSLIYDDLDGEHRTSGPHSLKVNFVEMSSPVTGFSSGMVLKSGTMMHFAQNLKTIGELYYASQDDINKINTQRDALWREKGEKTEAAYEDLTNPAIAKLEKSVQSWIRRALELTIDTKKEVNNARMRLDNEGFDDELEILDSYITILGEELELEQKRRLEIAGDIEITPPVQERSLQDNLKNLFREMTLDLSVKGAGVIAVSGFTAKAKESSELLNLLNEMAVTEIAKIDTLKMVERSNLDAVLKEQELALTDLMDTTKAISVGKLLTADYIVTGSVIEMSSSVVIFGRIINVESGEVESVAQVIVPRDRDVEKLLG